MTTNNEGELKKRFQPLIDLVEDEFGGGISGEGFKYDVHEILDEVAKELRSSAEWERWENIEFICIPISTFDKWFGSDTSP